MTDNDPKRIEFELNAAGSSAVRKLQLILFQALTSATPVDTGHARASLTPAVGSPIVDRLERSSDESTARQEASSRFSAHKAKSLAISSTYSLDQGRVFLIYRAPYVVFLNEGSSSQAPKKFVDRAVAASVRALGSNPLT
tara:strand:- start:748 stop:1167 length:420 start_codon:yes stop_codon:yes gene_type:complete